MKKQLISTLLVASALSLAGAQTTVSDATATPVLPPPPSVGDMKIDTQIRALNQEMEAKIRAIRQEYQTKLKAIIGNRKAVIASTTQQFRDDKRAAIASTTQQFRDDRKELKGEFQQQKQDLRGDIQQRREEVRGTSTPEARLQNVPQGNAFGFLQRFFGLIKATGTNDR